MDSVGQPIIVTGHDYTFNNCSGAWNCTELRGQGHGWSVENRGLKVVYSLQEKTS